MQPAVTSFQSALDGLQLLISNISVLHKINSLSLLEFKLLILLFYAFHPYANGQNNTLLSKLSSCNVFVSFKNKNFVNVVIYTWTIQTIILKLQDHFCNMRNKHLHKFASKYSII